jgi:ribosomal protein S18 acetylase RimI-like enzyme
MGYLAMQFNLVVSSNEVAVRLWQKLGFRIIGTLPGAFRHSQLGFVDAYVMYKHLAAA